MKLYVGKVLYRIADRAQWTVKEIRPNGSFVLTSRGYDPTELVFFAGQELSFQD